MPSTNAVPSRLQLWKEEKLMTLLDVDISETLFVSGCASNMGSFIQWFDDVILLSAPVDLMLERIRLRTNNRYGKEGAKIIQIQENRREFEPRLRRIANHEIDTSFPIQQVIERILQVAELL